MNLFWIIDGNRAQNSTHKNHWEKSHFNHFAFQSTETFQLVMREKKRTIAAQQSVMKSTFHKVNKFFFLLFYSWRVFLEFIAGASFIYLFIPLVASECKLSLQVLIHHLDVCWICGGATVPIFSERGGGKKKTKKEVEKSEALRGENLFFLTTRLPSHQVSPRTASPSMEQNRNRLK